MSPAKLPCLLVLGRSCRSSRTVLWITLRSSPLSSPVSFWSFYGTRDSTRFFKTREWFIIWKSEPPLMFFWRKLTGFGWRHESRKFLYTLRVMVTWTITLHKYSICTLWRPLRSSAVGMIEKVLLKVYLGSIGGGSLKLWVEMDSETISGICRKE